MHEVSEIGERCDEKKIGFEHEFNRLLPIDVRLFDVTGNKGNLV